MRTYTLTINGLEARVTLEHGANTISASGIVFDEYSNIVTERDTLRYSGFCDAEIVYSIAGDMLTTRRRIEHEDVADAVQALGLTCTCDDE